MSWLFLVLLALSVAVLVGAEWPRLSPRIGLEGRRKRERARRKKQFRVVSGDSDSEKFAASVERDLANLPTTEEHERR